jgi:hypothetical protein
MKRFLIELAGWYGAAAIILAYALISFSVLTAESLWYQVLNGTGALGIVIIAFSKKDYQPGILNLLWAVIACVALVRIIW